VGRKFRRAGDSLAKWRELDAYIIKNQKVPRDADVRPVRADEVPAEWVRAPAARADRAILYLHGGGFIMGSPATHRELAARISAVSGMSMLVVDYRLAPEHPFPAAMHDAVAAYRWLLGEGFRPEHLAVGGDSAGGGLALQTLLALRDEDIPLPAAAFFLSPVTDMVHLDGESYRTRAAADPFIVSESCRSMMPYYVGDNDPATPLLTPYKMDLAGLPPLRIHVGDHEVLLSDAVRFAERARECGVDAELKVWPGLWHVFQAAARFIPEGRESIGEIGRFIVNHVDQRAAPH
jgi:acetyl esterase/lipase